MEPFQTYFIECGCHANEHIIKIAWDPDEPDIGIFFSMQLQQHRSLFQRVKNAAKYILNRENSCSWHDIIWEPETVSKIKIILHQFESEHTRKEIGNKNASQ
jgi:hypothetical protein